MLMSIVMLITSLHTKADLVGAADIVVVSGGNTLYATDRWNQIGLVEHFTAAHVSKHPFD